MQISFPTSIFFTTIGLCCLKLSSTCLLHPLVLGLQVYAIPGSLHVISNIVEKVLQIINNTVSLGVSVLATPKIGLQKSFSRRLITLTNSLRVKFWTTHKTKRHTQITSTRHHHFLMGGLLPETQHNNTCQIRPGALVSKLRLAPDSRDQTSHSSGSYPK